MIHFRHTIEWMVLFCFLLAPTAQAAEAVNPLKAGVDRLELNIRNALSNHADGNRTWKLAVFDFENLSESAKETNMGRTLSGLLITKLVQSAGITLVEREDLDKIIREQELSLAGLNNPTTAKTIGKLLNIDAMIVGDVTDIQNDYYVNMRMVDTVRGTVLGATSTRIHIADKGMSVGQKRAKIVQQIQKDIDALTQAIHLYSNIESPRAVKVVWPAKLTDLVPDYLSRIPPPVEGHWAYNATTGELHNSAYPEIRSTITYPKLGPVFKEIRRSTTQRNLREIQVFIANYTAEMGTWPSSLEELASTFGFDLPDASPGKWVYNSQTGDVAYSE